MTAFALTEDQIAIREMAQDFAAETLAPHAARWDEEKHFPVAEMRAAAALGFPIAVASTLGYLAGGWNQPPALPGALGFLYLPAVAAIAAASVTLAPLGARAAHRMPVERLRRIFALLLMALAGYMAWKGLA